MLEIMVPKQRSGPEEHEVKVGLRPYRRVGADKLLTTGHKSSALTRFPQNLTFVLPID